MPGQLSLFRHLAASPANFAFFASLREIASGSFFRAVPREK